VFSSIETVDRGCGLCLGGRIRRCVLLLAEEAGQWPAEVANDGESGGHGSRFAIEWPTEPEALPAGPCGRTFFSDCCRAGDHSPAPHLVSWSPRQTAGADTVPALPARIEIRLTNGVCTSVTGH